MFRILSLATLMFAAGLCAAYPPVPKSGKGETYKARLMPLYYPHLLLDAEIQKTVGIAEVQIKQIEDLTRKFCEDERAKQQDKDGGQNLAVPPAPPAEFDDGDLRMQIQFTEARDRVVKPILETVLKPDQTERIRQIDVQLQGPGAFLERRMLRLLKPNAEQEDLLEDVQLALQKDLADLDDLSDEGPSPEDLKKMARLYARAMKKCREILTPDQWKQFAERCGKPVPPKLLIPLILKGDLQL